MRALARAEHGVLASLSLRVCDSLESFGAPRRPDATIQISAKYDEYVPDRLTTDYGLWKGARLDVLETGHVSTLMQQTRLVNTIEESFRLLGWEAPPTLDTGRKSAFPPIF